MKFKNVFLVAAACTVLVLLAWVFATPLERYANRISERSERMARLTVAWFLPKFDPANLTVEDANARLSLPLYMTIPAENPGALTRANGYPKKETFTSWYRSHGDMGSSRYSLLDQINTSNVKDLKLAWIYHSKDATPERKYTPVQANPVVANGVIYIPTPGHSIVAINAKTGEEIWRFQSPEKFPAKRGLIWWQGTEKISPRIYFAAGYLLVALDAKTGKLVREFGNNGTVKSFRSSVAPAIAKGRIVIGTFKPSIEAFDVVTGATSWTFDILQNDTSIFDVRPNELTGGNPWGGLATDEERGVVYISTGNPQPTFVGVTRPGDNKNANSVVALDIRSGKKLWSFQEVRHDLWDLDIPASPLLTTISHNGERIDVVATVTKIGNTLLLDRLTGKPIFPFRLKRAATSNIPGEITSPYQPAIELPVPLANQEFSLKDVTNIGEANREFVLAKLRDAKLGLFVPPEIGKRLVFFGSGGGGEWPGATVDQQTGVLYVSSNNMPWEVTLDNVGVADESALPVTEGRKLFLDNCSSCHGVNREGSAGPRLVRVGLRLDAKELKSVVTNGRRAMPGFSSLPDEQVDSLIGYLLERDKFIETAGSAKPNQHGAVRFENFQTFTDQEGYPASKPPWGLLNALDLNTGHIIWQVPLGEHDALTKRGVPITGTENYGGAIVTAGGLVFVGGTQDLKFRAFDKSNGKELWSYSLPFGGFAPPATYEADGRQYVIIPAVGGRFLAVGDTPELRQLPADEFHLPGDALVAFSLPVVQ